MPEISGYGKTPEVSPKPIESPEVDPTERSDNTRPIGRVEGLKGVEVVLSSERRDIEADTYEELRPASNRARTEQPTVDELRNQQVQRVEDNPPPSEVDERDAQAVEKML